MKRFALLVALALLVPLPARAAPTTGSWQLYTIAHGLIEQETFAVAPDNRGGVWVGHISGGRGIYRSGGLSHIAADGSARAYRREEPFASCSSVDALAPTPDGRLWMRLSGYHDYGHTDHTRTCSSRYGIPDPSFPGEPSEYNSFAIGFINPSGEPHMIPKEQLPAEVTGGLVSDALGRPWMGTRDGLVVREHDGNWRKISFWSAADGRTTALHAFANGTQIVVGSETGSVAAMTIQDGEELVTILPRPSDARHPVVDLAASPAGVAAIINGQLYRQSLQSGGWDRIGLPGTPGGEDLAYAGGTFWLAQGRLYRLESNNWTVIPTGSTPLPDSGISDLVSASENTLLIATSQGVARLDTAGPSPDPTVAQRAFDALWQRTNTAVGNSWVWGPRAWDERYEAYKEGPGGVRFVRYYDKARMELPDPNADSNSQWYVTNGLLVVEMVRGLVQMSNDPDQGACPIWRSREPCPAGQPVAGDLSYDNWKAPSYSHFEPLLQGAPRRVGQRVGTTLTRDNDINPFVTAEQPALASEATTIAAFDDVTQHNIPQVFWNYLQQQPVDWLFAFGRPITEPYWITTQIGGTERWVLVHLFERRTLTYTPTNPAAWQVEMGNVGQHYFGWRYSVTENPPWAR